MPQDNPHGVVPSCPLCGNTSGIQRQNLNKDGHCKSCKHTGPYSSFMPERLPHTRSNVSDAELAEMEKNAVEAHSRPSASASFRQSAATTRAPVAGRSLRHGQGPRVYAPPPKLRR